MRRHRRDLTPLTQINLTSLLDVAFVLLIAFMIVAPSLKYGLDLDLPTIKEGAPQLKQDNAQVFTVRIPKGSTGQFILNDSPATAKELEQRLSIQRQTNKNVAVEIQADKNVPYELFAQAVSAVRRAGIEAVALPLDVTGAEATPAPRSTSDLPSPAASRP